MDHETLCRKIANELSFTPRSEGSNGVRASGPRSLSVSILTKKINDDLRVHAAFSLPSATWNAICFGAPRRKHRAEYVEVTYEQVQAAVTQLLAKGIVGVRGDVVDLLEKTNRS